AGRLTVFAWMDAVPLPLVFASEVDQHLEEAFAAGTASSTSGPCGPETSGPPYFSVSLTFVAPAPAIIKFCAQFELAAHASALFGFYAEAGVTATARMLGVDVREA